MEYKMFVTDFDGTLANDDIEISPENLSAIQAAQREGVTFVVATGRAETSINKFIGRIDIDKENTYVLAYNGALIYRLSDGEILFDCPLQKEYAAYISKEAINFDVNVQMYKGGKLYAEHRSPRIDYYSRAAILEINIVDFNDILNSDVSKVLYNAAHDELCKAQDFFADWAADRINMFLSSDNLLEFNNKDADKGKGILMLAERLGISRQSIIAMGDNYNDLPMIDVAGLGVTLAHARESIKEHADHVTAATNNEHAVAEVINTFIRRQ